MLRHPKSSTGATAIQALPMTFGRQSLLMHRVVPQHELRRGFLLV